jgi:hypothetical protein
VTRSITPEISSVAGLRSEIAALIGDSGDAISRAIPWGWPESSEGGKEQSTNECRSPAYLVVFSLSEDEKRLLLEAGVEFTDVRKAAQGESVSFVMGESDPRYERVAALLKSLGKERFRDFSMTVPTLQEFIEKVLRPSAERLKQEGYFATQAKWEYGREVMRQSLEFLKKGEGEQALQLLDAAIAEAIQNNHSGVSDYP